MPSHQSAGEPGFLRGALIGVALVLVGVGLVEASIFAGLRPLGPLGWPGLWLIAGVAFGGGGALAGGGLVFAAYYFQTSRNRSASRNSSPATARRSPG